MINKEKYFENGKLKRESIAMDIKYHRISHEDLLALIEDPDISREFYGDSYADKIPQEEWNEQYLDKLSYAVVSEAFNKDYLLYLEQVANVIGEKKINSKIIIGGIVLAVAVIVLVVVLVSKLNYTPENGHGFWLGRYHIPISWTVNLR